jgi:hypothetical protein
MKFINRLKSLLHYKALIGALSFLAALIVVYSPRQPYNRDLAILLPSATYAEPELSQILGGEQQVKAVVNVATTVYQYFIYDTVGHSREPIPAQLKKTFEHNIGECDTSARLFIKMLREAHVANEVKFRQFNLISVQDKLEHVSKAPGRYLIGHTIAAMESERGSLGVDLTFGFLILTPKTTFDERVFQTREYKLYRLYDRPSGDWDGTYNGIGIAAYRLMENPDSSAAFNEGELHAVSQTFSLKSKLTVIGKIDGRSTDISAQFGAWMDHVGYYYTPGEHVWNFRAPVDGIYNIIFLFAPRTNAGFDTNNMPPRLSLATTGASEIIAPRDGANIVVNDDRLSLLVRAKKGRFGVSLGAKTPGARHLDAITIQREDDDGTYETITDMGLMRRSLTDLHFLVDDRRDATVVPHSTARRGKAPTN